MPLDTKAATARPENRRRVLLAHSLLSAVLISVGFASSEFRLDFEKLIYPSCVLLTVTFIWILWSWFWLRKALFEPYPIFMMAAGLFNGGQAVLEVFKLNPSGVLDGRVSPDTLVPALYLVTIGATFLHIGALLALGPSPVGSTHIATATSSSQRAARMTGLILLAISAVPTVMLLRQSVSVVMDSGYMGLYQGSGPQALTRILSAFLIPGTIFLIVGSRNTPKIQVVCFVVIGCYTLVYLFLGGRAAATTGCTAVVWAFDRSIRRIPRRMILIAGLVAVVVFGLVEQTRELAGRNRLSLESQYDALTNLENPLTEPIAEMGGSLLTVTHTLLLVPEGRSFDWGVSYWYAILTIIPNLGWDVHPSVAHGLLADWLVRIVEPVVAARGGGLGFSFIAEAYLNFGWYGAPVCLAILGYLLCRLFLLADSADLAKQAMVASFLSFILVFPRGESAIVVRGLVWYAVLPYLLMTALATQRRIAAALPKSSRLRASGILSTEPRLVRTARRRSTHPPDLPPRSMDAGTARTVLIER